MWGDSWESAKTQCESFDYLFQSAVQMKTLLHMDPGATPKSGTYRTETPETLEGVVPARAKKRTKRTHGGAASAAGNATSPGFNGMGLANNREDLLSNSVPILPRDAKVLLLDIEGCTTSISFVKDQLFPYILDHLVDFVDNTLSPNAEEFTITLNALTADLNSVGMAIPEEHAQDVNWMVHTLMEQDIKVPGLKALQGKMWKSGYECGTIKGHVYTDVWYAFQWLKAKGIRICIFSSGSVQAQKLLFGHSVDGDLLDSIEAHFDITSSGNKKVASSYENIAKSLGVSPSHIVFCSDAEAELVAAKEAGIGYQVMTIRPGNVPLTEVGYEFPEIYSLMQLCGE